MCCIALDDIDLSTQVIIIYRNWSVMTKNLTTSLLSAILLLDFDFKCMAEISTFSKYAKLTKKNFIKAINA